MAERKRVTYSKEFKEIAAELYLEGKKSYKTLIGELGIKDTKTLRSWVAKYQRGESLEEGREKKQGGSAVALKRSLPLSKKNLPL